MTMVCRRSYRKEWDELIEKAKGEGITPYNLGKELFQNEYRKIYKKELPICRCLYEDLQKAYNELSKNSLLNQLQSTNQNDIIETNADTIRHRQIDGEIGFEIKPFSLINESENEEMKKFIKRKNGYNEVQYAILDKVNEGKSEEEIKRELNLKGPQYYHAINSMVDEDATNVEFQPDEERFAEKKEKRKYNKHKKDEKNTKGNKKKTANLLTTEIKLPVRIIDSDKKCSENLQTFVDLLNKGKSLSDIHYELNMPYGAISKLLKVIETVPDNEKTPEIVSENEVEEIDDEKIIDNLGTLKLIDEDETQSDELNVEERINEEVEKFNENLTNKVTHAVEEVESAGAWNIYDWYAPIMFEPPTDRPVPTPVKKSIPMFEWLEDRWIDIGGTCYKLDVNFSIMDGDKHVKYGTSIFVESIENGVKRPYMMSVPQFLRFTESRYSYWIVQKIDRKYYDAHKQRAVNEYE